MQTPDEVAAAAWRALERREGEVVVGGAFKAMVAAYDLTGINPMAMTAP